MKKFLIRLDSNNEKLNKAIEKYLKAKEELEYLLSEEGLVVEETSRIDVAYLITPTNV